MPESGITHESLVARVIQLPGDYQPFGPDDRQAPYGPDCSCGCRWYAPLAGEVGFDWGVCCSPISHRRGLLTFEHQGCREFESDA